MLVELDKEGFKPGFGMHDDYQLVRESQAGRAERAELLS